MKILFDHQIFSSQVYGGVSKYFAEVIRRLPENTWEISAWLSNNEYARFHKLFKMTSFLPNCTFRGKGRIMASLGKPYSCYAMRRGDYDVVHQTNFDNYLFKSIGNKPMVTTYHDVNFLTGNGYNRRMARLQKISLDRADAVVAISENTKKDLLNYFDINEAKIQVIHHGIDIPIIPEGRGRVVKEPYILYVGTRFPFKNFTNFVKAFANIAYKYKGLKVVCTRQPFSVQEKELLNKLGILDRMEVIAADEITLNCLYRDALFFCFPSKYEGFGMPILEAMVNGCPTTLANASCFPEIAGDAAFYFDPNSIESMSVALDRMISDGSLRENLIELGLERAKLFSWQKSADAHYNLYKALV